MLLSHLDPEINAVALQSRPVFWTRSLYMNGAGAFLPRSWRRGWKTPTPCCDADTDTEEWLEPFTARLIHDPESRCRAV